MDDLISRQAAIDSVIEITYDQTALHHGWVSPYYVVNRLEYLPTAEPMTGLYVDGFNDGYKAGKEAAEPRKGKWIDGNEGKWNTAYCPKCSVCGTPFYGIEPVRYHYCPNCGAKMEESDG